MIFVIIKPVKTHIKSVHQKIKISNASFVTISQSNFILKFISKVSIKRLETLSVIFVIIKPAKLHIKSVHRNIENVNFVIIKLSNFILIFMWKLCKTGFTFQGLISYFFSPDWNQSLLFQSWFRSGIKSRILFHF